MFFPPVPELSDLLQALDGLGVDTHLQGYLGADGTYPFVDICHSAAEQVRGVLFPEFRLIYPSPISSEACMHGLEDPLQAECAADAEMWFSEPAGRPCGCDGGDNQAMLEQVRYLRRHGPSRLVQVQASTAERLGLQIQHLQAVLSAP